VKCNIAKPGAKPVRLRLTASFNETTIANLPDDFGESWEKRKWADGEADVGKAAETPPVITVRSMCDGYNAMVC
jgi:hypothetical protein